ncbi:MAG: cytochrome b [Candidatus Comchoanobacterales bacterium]
MNKVFQWIDDRLPVSNFVKNHLSNYQAPKNFNFWYYFGSLAILVFASQIISGIFLLMHYVPSEEAAFDSVEFIMRNVSFGWFLRYLHAVGASMFFVVIYLHMYRAFMYGSYKKPRELLYLLGAFLFLLLMAEAYTGYVLPWGQMSFNATKVILSILEKIPFIGDAVMTLVKGSPEVSGATLQRFFSFHVVVMPLMLIGFVYLHLAALHTVGSNNPDGIDVEKDPKKQGKNKQTVPFHPYYTVKDIFGAAVFLFVFLAIVMYAPTFFNYFIEKENFMPADPLIPVMHVKPVWYLSPFYSIVKATGDWGWLAMFSSVGLLFFMPWLDRAKVRSMRYRGWLSRIWLGLFILAFLCLMVLGVITTEYPILLKVCTAFYFIFFLGLPFISKYDYVKPLPKQLT